MEEEEREGGEEEAMAEVLRAMGAAVAHATAEEGAWPMGEMVRGRGELASRPEGEEGWAAQGRRGGGRAEPAAGGRGGRHGGSALLFHIQQFIVFGVNFCSSCD